MRWIAFAAFGGLLPFCIWLVGSCIVHLSPPVYEGRAILRVTPEQGGGRQACRDLRSGEVIGEAARSLAGEAPVDPMSSYLLWSSLTVREMSGSNLVKLEARGNSPDEARRIVMAVTEAYRKNTPGSGTEGTLVYLAPDEPDPERVSDETRIMLGIAGFASICLLLCLPFLRLTEGSMPLGMAPVLFPLLSRKQAPA